MVRVRTVRGDVVKGGERMYKYYLRLRPVGIGTQPQDMKDWHNFNGRVYVPEINHEAWGYAVYDRRLTPEEVYQYDLMEVKA